jgi:hypothetical protein
MKRATKKTSSRHYGRMRETLYSPSYQTWAEQYRPRKPSQRSVAHEAREQRKAA